MRAVITRVSSASVEIGGEVCGSIGTGFLVLLGVEAHDTDAQAKRLASKVAGLRVFDDEDGKMNLSLSDVHGAILVVSQFTLHADCTSRRPGFTRAARPETAIPLYELFITECRDAGFAVETGRFGAMMDVKSVNSGPVTIIMDTDWL